jgi:hypothetical protein
MRRISLDADCRRGHARRSIDMNFCDLRSLTQATKLPNDTLGHFSGRAYLSFRLLW